MARAAGLGEMRTLVVVAPIVAGLATAALLALEAHRGSGYHRRSVEGVLRDYATLAAGEMVRRSAVEIGYYGHSPLIAAVQREAAGPGGLRPGVLSTLAARSAALGRAVTLARGTFAWDAGTAELRPHDGPLDPETARWLASRLRGLDTRKLEGFAYAHGVLAGVPRSFVYAAGPPGLVGYEVDLGALRAWLQQATDRAPLVPGSLGNGAVTNASVSLVVLDQAGSERFRSGTANPGGLGVEVPFAEAYEGVLRGSRVQASLDPAVAPLLVVGGLPRSRLPIVAVLLGLTGALLVTAVLQLQRERALQRLRTEFVANVSHELRTPVTQIRMFAETLLLDRVRSPAEARRSLQIIDKESRRLAHLVENVLQLSRPANGAAPPARAQRDLGALVREVVDDFQPLLSGTGARITHSLEDGVRAQVDPDALRQVVLNLLDNAAKYGPPDQEIRVSLHRQNGAARITVEDAGPGIPARDRERIFRRFYRLPRDERRAVAGTGIGLAVVRDLVQRNGGRCRVEEAAGGGARFVVELPA
jgi:signal transduction histidine kinase